MTLPVFLVDTAALAADAIEVTGAEGRHATVVRRIAAGERILLTDGGGVGAECVVRSVAKGSLVADVVARRAEPEPAPRVVVVQALVKGGGGEAAVDLLTQVGVDVIVPWAAARSFRWRQDDAHRGEAGRQGVDKVLARWQSTARESGKQARRLRLPRVDPQHSTEQVARRLSVAALAVVLHESADARLSEVSPPVDGDVVLVVGPEGGLSDGELATLVDAGGQPVRMGPTVLRASTAGAVAAVVLLSRTRRWT